MTPRERTIVAAAFITQAVAVGTTIGAYALYVPPLAVEFGASTAQASLGAALIMLSLSLSGIAVGGLMDRFAMRTIMFAGALGMGFVVWLASLASALWQLALCSTAIGLLMPTVGPLASSVLAGKSVAPERRGRALGFANMGVPVGGMVFAALAGWMLESQGLRGVWAIFGVAVAAIACPAVLLLVPRELDLAEDAETEDASAPIGEGVALLEDGGIGALIRRPVFYGVAGAFGVGVGIMSGWAPQLARFVLDAGGANAQATFAASAASGIAIVGTIVFGALADRVGPERLWIGLLAALAGGFVLLASVSSVPVLLAVICGMGICTGGALPVYSLLLTQRFGAASLGLVLGASNLFILPLGFGAGPVAGAVRDATGSYAPAQLGFALLLLAAAGLVFRTRR